MYFTETCDDASPHLITHVETTSGPVADGEATPQIHAALAQRDLLPACHVVDTGYLDAALLVASERDYAVDLYGPTRLDYRWQARAETGFDAAHFVIDWAQQRVTCPAGRASLSWTPAIDNRKNAVIKIKFSRTDCRPCPLRQGCTRAPRRTVTGRPAPQYQALQAARERERSPTYRAEYARRAGVEGTISQAVRRCRVRRARYRGQAKTHLQHVLTATALNVVRLAAWLAGTPAERTRQTASIKLMSQPLAA